jgi:hypothetical protein
MKFIVSVVMGLLVTVKKISEEKKFLGVPSYKTGSSLKEVFFMS